jgi:hypothetical protein
MVTSTTRLGLLKDVYVHLYLGYVVIPQYEVDGAHPETEKHDQT